MPQKNKPEYEEETKVLLLQTKTPENEKVYAILKNIVGHRHNILNMSDDLATIFKSTPEIIQDLVGQSDLIIGNVGDSNLSVYLGLGVARTMNIPILLIAPSGRSLSVPTGLFRSRLIQFSIDDPSSFVESFGYEIENALLHGTSNTLKPSENSVFISYSHHDTEFLERLMTHLRPLNKAGLIQTWDDTQLRTGDLWQDEIQKALKQARAAVLLLSADFMASEFIIENELPPLLEKAQAEGTRIIPVIVKPCRFKRDKNISCFHAVNDPDKPLISLQESEKEQIYDKIAMEIEAAIGK